MVITNVSINIQLFFVRHFDHIPDCINVRSVEAAGKFLGNVERGWGNVGQNVQKSTNPLLLCEQLWHLEFFTGACFYFQYERRKRTGDEDAACPLYLHLCSYVGFSFSAAMGFILFVLMDSCHMNEVGPSDFLMAVWRNPRLLRRPHTSKCHFII